MATMMSESSFRVGFGTMRLFALLVGVGVAHGRLQGGAAEPRTILERNVTSVVTIRLVGEVEFSGGGRTSRREIPLTGLTTLVQPDGWFVGTLTSFDPTETLERMVSRAAARAGAKPEFRLDGYKQAKAVFADGAEVAVDVMLKDEQTDLMFFRAKPETWVALKPTRTAISLGKAGTARVFDEVIVVGRVGGAFAGEPLGIKTEVLACAKKPRDLLLIGRGEYGVPAFTLDGRLLGIVTRSVNNGRTSADHVVVGAAEVADLLRQARAMPPPPAVVEPVTKEPVPSPPPGETDAHDPDSVGRPTGK